MNDTKLAPVESRFADIIWENAPLSSGELVRLCNEQLEWKKSTTYTVLKKLCDRGIFQNDHGLVSPLLTRKEFYSRQSRQYVEDSFSGSLPAFVAAFTGGKKLSEAQIAEIQSMIDRFGED